MGITEQVSLNKKGKPIAIQLPVRKYKKLLTLAEEMADIKAYGRAMKRKHNFTSFTKAIKELKLEE